MIRGLPRDGVNSNRREWRGQFSAVHRGLERDHGHYSAMAFDVAVPQTFHRIHKTEV
jgi:hypothetical protein